MTKLALYEAKPSVRIVTGACPHDCPDTCSWQIAVERSTEQALDIWGHPDHPVTQGTLCGKVDRYLERVYHADRLTHPLRRVGPKGSGHFERISWGDAFEASAARLQRIIDEWGAEAVLPYAYAGTMGYLQQEGISGPLLPADGGQPPGAHDLLRGRIRRLPLHDRLHDRHRAGGFRPRAADPDLGQQHADQQPAPVAVHPGGAQAGRPRRRHRPGAHAHGQSRRRVDSDPPRHRRRAGAGHDARDHQRRSA